MNTKLAKKFAVLPILLLSLMLVFGCGKEAEVLEFDPATVGAVASSAISVFQSVPPENYEAIQKFDEEDLTGVTDMLATRGLKISNDAFANGFNSYVSAVGEMGNFTSISEPTDITATATDITALLEITGTNDGPGGSPRTCTAEIILSKNLTVKNVAFNIDRTTGEKLANAGLNTLLGMGTTFSILILISIVIWALSFIPKILSGESKQKPQTESPVDKTIDQIISREEQEKEEKSDNDELIAVIAAAIAAYESEATGRAVSPDTFIVRSLKKH
ncbi:MAG: OadG family protein [Lachnospiraceae bacterium]|nr:OadG family protein [Lachnospiraceae bacterium]